MRRQGLVAVPAVVALGLAGAACPGTDEWTGRSVLPEPLTAPGAEYREYRGRAEGEEEPWVVFTVKPVHGHPTDAVLLPGLTRLVERAHDDGRGDDARGNDGEHTGRYRVGEHRRDPAWLARTRPSAPGGWQRVLPPAQEARHPHAHRRDLVGGAGGVFDTWSVCPPHHLLVGVRFRRDRVAGTLVQVAPWCRVDPRSPLRADAPPVAGSAWGEEVKATAEVVACAAGSAVQAQGHAHLGRWLAHEVVAGLTLACAPVVAGGGVGPEVLQVGNVAGEGRRFACAGGGEGGRVPWAVGLRLVAGQRVDAVGFACDEGPGGPPGPLVAPGSPGDR